MIRRALRQVRAVPRAAHAIPPGPRDWVLVTAVAVIALLEGVLRPDVVWRPVAVVMAVGPAFTLPWRRVHPLGMFALAFGVVSAVQVAAIAAGLDATVGLSTGIYLLVLVYAVPRWGSGLEAMVAGAVLVAVVALGFGRDYTTPTELLLELAVIGIAAVSGVAVRAQSDARARELARVRLSEREQLARELHDTVAHHVSAMVVRAQAGRVVAATDPAAAVEALDVIEAEGSRTLAEMRVLVGALRDGDDPAVLAPRTAADIPSLSRGPGAGPRVEVVVSGDVDTLHPSVSAALYRIAQESVTNALRHAVGATTVSVSVAADGDAVDLRVVDDGEPVDRERAASGYGIVGMAERVGILGGTLTAGPGPERGWVVEAHVPRTGVGRR